MPALRLRHADLASAATALAKVRKRAKPGSKIGPGASTFGGTIYAAPAAMVSNASLPADILIVTKSYTTEQLDVQGLGASTLAPFYCVTSFRD